MNPGPALLLPALWGQPVEVPLYPKADAVEVAVVKELSRARTAPREYAGFLRELRPLFEGKKLKQPTSPRPPARRPR